jgi:transcriptional regulator with XRE-family HTH domain
MEVVKCPEKESIINHGVMTSLRALLAHNMKEKRRILDISQARLAERVSTSTHYIGQIELGNKFPSPDMLERIASALEIDSPELFSMTSFPLESMRQFQEGVLSSLEKAVSAIVTEQMKKIGIDGTSSGLHCEEGDLR